LVRPGQVLWAHRHEASLFEGSLQVVLIYQIPTRTNSGDVYFRGETLIWIVRRHIQFVQHADAVRVRPGERSWVTEIDVVVTKRALGHNKKIDAEGSKYLIDVPRERLGECHANVRLDHLDEEDPR